jgi:hypothetical protein
MGGVQGPAIKGDRRLVWRSIPLSFDNLYDVNGKPEYWNWSNAKLLSKIFLKRTKVRVDRLYNQSIRPIKNLKLQQR